MIMGRRTHHQGPFSLFSFQDIIMSVTGIIILITLLLTLQLVQRVGTASAAPSSLYPDEVRQAIRDTQSQVKALRKQLQSGRDAAAESAAISGTTLTRQLAEIRQQVKRLTMELARLDGQTQTATREHDHWKARQFDQAADRRKLTELRKLAATLAAELEHLRKTNRVVYNPSSMVGKTAWLVDIGTDGLLVAQAGKKGAPRRFGGSTPETRVAAFLKWARLRNASSEYFVLLVRPHEVRTYGQVRSGLEPLRFQMGFDVLGADVTVIDPQHGAAY